MLTLHPILDEPTWEAAHRAYPAAHILQSWAWGEFKRRTTGWQPHRFALLDDNERVGVVSIGLRSVGPARVLYAPKGPVLRPDADAALWGAALSALQRYARQQRAIWLKTDPDVLIATGEEATPAAQGQSIRAAYAAQGWRFSADQVQFRNTIVLDLHHDAETLLAAMSQNTRRKIRTAEKKGVTVRLGTPADLPTLYALYQTTGVRDGFLIRPFSYYEQAWASFMQAGLAQPLIAEAEGQALAMVMLFHYGQRCWYFYGASSNEARERMPNYALQWAAIQWAQAQGYASYDFWGAPDVFDESDRLWGVYEFKRGFRGTVLHTLGAWDYAPYPPLYWGYTQAMPRLRALLRRNQAPSTTSVPNAGKEDA